MFFKFNLYSPKEIIALGYFFYWAVRIIYLDTWLKMVIKSRFNRPTKTNILMLVARFLPLTLCLLMFTTLNTQLMSFTFGVILAHVVAVILLRLIESQPIEIVKELYQPLDHLEIIFYGFVTLWLLFEACFIRQSYFQVFILVKLPILIFLSYHLIAKVKEKLKTVKK